MDTDKTSEHQTTFGGFDNAEREIKQIKEWRVELDALLQRMKEGHIYTGGRNRALAITHLEDSIMRLGMVLKDYSTPNPYPNSYNPENAVVDPTADGLKL